MHRQPLFTDCDFISVDGTDVGGDIFTRGLCLPSDIKMTEEEQYYIIDTIKTLFDI